VSDHVVVFSTVGRPEDADRIARALVEQRAAACVSFVPGLVSHYRWKGACEREAETLLVIKTRKDRLEDLRQALLAIHPYELPEFLALSVEAGHAPYLAWLDASVGTGSD
jgi:periplasmic divalent cation tolerance protein